MSMLAQKPPKPEIGNIGKSSLLSSLEDFLPKMKKANDQVEQQLKQGASRAQFDIEAVDEEAPHIEMKLHLGVGEEIMAAADSTNSTAGLIQDLDGKQDQMDLESNSDDEKEPENCTLVPC